MAVSRRLRFEVMTRDNFTCRYCGRTPPEVQMTVDHVVPVALAGSDDPSNLVAACRECNAGKSSIAPGSTMVAQVADDALRFAAALEHVTRQRRQRIRDMEENIAWFDQAWGSWTYPDNDGNRQTIERDDDWAQSVERFFVAGLNREDLKRLIDVAMNYKQAWDVWRFFCGKAWQEIRERQEAARHVLTTAQPADTDDSHMDVWSEGFDAGWQAARLAEPPRGD